MNGWIGLIFTVHIYSLKGQKRNNSGDPGTCHPVPLSGSITTELLCEKIPTDSSAHHRAYELSRTVKSGTTEQIFLFFGVILHATVLLWESISVQYMAGNMREVDRPSCISPTHSHTHRCVGMGKGPSVWERWREGSIEQRKSAVNHERRQKPPVFPQCTRLC